ncbi:MAG: response regulator [Leptolyngbyaceae cyanobacterium MO_188.B28]|nr:response regulator [Leptolyngbyaceae cyanobacterium MO_188.B28]
MANILIFEDELPLALHWRQRLEAAHHTVQQCDTIPQAIKITESTPPDLVIVDMLVKRGNKTMPEGGLNLIAKLKLMNKVQPIIIGVSGLRRSRYMASTPLDVANQMGIDMALQKPISPDYLLGIVSRLLEDKTVSQNVG